MRTVSQAFLDNMTHERTPSAYAIVRDTRLSFVDLWADETGLFAHHLVRNQDSINFGTGVVQIAVGPVTGNDFIFYRYIADMNSFPAWTNSNIQIKNGSTAALIGNRLFYQLPADGIRYRVLSTSGSNLVIGSETTFVGSYAEPVAIAPVTTTDIYLYRMSDPAEIIFRQASGTNIVWSGRPFAAAQTAFDAERVNEIDYLFFHDKDDKRSMTVQAIYSGGVMRWSDVEPLLPLDIVDDQSFFRITAATTINSELWLTGILSRSSGMNMQIYTIGAAVIAGIDHYTMGRDMFVGSRGVKRANGSPGAGGKLHVVNNEVWYLGVGVKFKAPGSMQIGYDNPDRKVTLTSLNNLQVEWRANSPANLTFDFVGTHPALRTHSEIELYCKYGSAEAFLGTFEIDRIANSENDRGQSKTLTGRGKTIRRLNMWQSDASYDYQSQTKQSVNPSLETEMIRASGKWYSQDGAIMLEDIASPGLLYSASSPGRNSIARARFRRTDTNHAFYGVVLNYGIEGHQAAKARLGREPEAGEYNQSGLMAIIETVGTPAVRLYWRENDNYTLLASANITLPGTNVWHWLQIEFHDGEIIVRYRLDTNTDWSTMITHKYSLITSPWAREERGRGGIYMLNYRSGIASPGFDSQANVIPVQTTVDFPSSGYTQTDREVIQHSSKTGYIDFSPSHQVVAGLTLPEAPHDNNWGARILYDIAFIEPWSDQNVGQSTANAHLARSFTALGRMTVTQVTFTLRKVGTPATVYCHLVKAPYMHNLDPTHVVATASIAGGSIGTGYTQHNFSFNATIDAGIYWLVVTATPAGGAPVISGTSYFQFRMRNNFIDPYGTSRLYSTISGWSTLATALPFQLTAVGTTGKGYEIYLDTSGAIAARTIYDNAALVVSEGSGKGSVYKITDYDYLAPKIWVPTQSYTPPDSWQDHIGDPAHGFWEQPDQKRIFVDRHPGALQPGSTVKIYSALQVQTRGVYDTLPASHYDDHPNEPQVRNYAPPSVQCNHFDYFTAERDISFDHMATEIARKAGVKNVIVDRSQDTLVFGGGGWSVRTQMAQSEQTRQDLIVRFTASGEAGIAFRMSQQPGAYDYGKIVTVSSTHVSLYLYLDNVVTLRERVPISGQAGAVTISVQDNHYAVWINDRFVHAFTDDDAVLGSLAGFVSNLGSTINYEWSDLDRRVDSFFMDVGKPATGLLNDLIGEKLIFYHEGSNGLRLYTQRPSIPGTYNLTVIREKTEQTDIITRLRVEGAGIGEYFDEAAMLEHGNLFSMINLSDIESDYEAKQEATRRLVEILSQQKLVVFAGAADPRIEPNDKIVNDGQVVVVQAVSFNLSISESQAQFDMTIEGNYET